MSDYIDRNTTEHDDFGRHNLPGLDHLQSGALRKIHDAAAASGYLLNLHRALVVEIDCGDINISPFLMDKLVQAAQLLSEMSREAALRYAQRLSNEQERRHQVREVTSC